MYRLILGICLLVSGIDVCMMVSKKIFKSDRERDYSDQEQMEYLTEWNQRNV